MAKTKINKTAFAKSKTAKPKKTAMEQKYGFVAGWEKDFKDAQKHPYLMDKQTGKLVKRVKYGEEKDDWGAKSGRRCHDCGVTSGQYHLFGCDVERTPHDKDSQLLGSDRYGDYYTG